MRHAAMLHMPTLWVDGSERGPILPRVPQMTRELADGDEYPLFGNGSLEFVVGANHPKHPLSPKRSMHVRSSWRSKVTHRLFSSSGRPSGQHVQKVTQAVEVGHDLR